MAREHVSLQIPEIGDLIAGSAFYRAKGNLRRAAFELHQAVETAYSAFLLTLTNYSPPSHNLKFLRGLAEDKDRRLVDVWPRDQHRYTAWYNVLNEAYVKARYSKHFVISEEALDWLMERTELLHKAVETLCAEHIAKLELAVPEKLA